MPRRLPVSILLASACAGLVGCSTHDSPSVIVEPSVVVDSESYGESTVEYRSEFAVDCMRCTRTTADVEECWHSAGASAGDPCGQFGTEDKVCIASIYQSDSCEETNDPNFTASECSTKVRNKWALKQQIKDDGVNCTAEQLGSVTWNEWQRQQFHCSSDESCTPTYTNVWQTACETTECGGTVTATFKRGHRLECINGSDCGDGSQIQE